MDRRTFLKATGGLATSATFSPESLRAAFSQIKHIVAVMMENRSFDHSLGWLSNAKGKQAGLSFEDVHGVIHPTHELAQDLTGCGFNDPDHSYQGGRTEVAHRDGQRPHLFERRGVDCKNTAISPGTCSPCCPFHRMRHPIQTDFDPTWAMPKKGLFCGKGHHGRDHDRHNDRHARYDADCPTRLSISVDYCGSPPSL